MKTIQQAALLLLSFLFVFAWQNTILSQYTVQVLGALVFCYLILSALKKDPKNGKGFNPIDLASQGYWGIMILNTIIVLFVIATGGFNSMLFFLLFFLAFAIAFAFEPVIVFVFVLGTVTLFLPDALQSDEVRNIIMLASLVFLSPLAYFFGKEQRKEQEESKALETIQQETTQAAEAIIQDVNAVLNETKNSLPLKESEQLHNALKNASELKEKVNEVEEVSKE